MRPREHAPGVALRPRDVDEVVQEDVGPGAAHEAGQRVEVVVVDHHHRVVDAVDLLDHGLGEVLVDDVVAVLEGLDLVAPHVRGVAEVPEVVLDEPQHRVGEDVVEAVVGVGVGGHEAHLVLAPARRLDRERPTARLVGAAHVGVAERTGDPRRVAVGGQAGERRDQAARPALDRPVVLEGHRPAVGDQDQAAGGGARPRARLAHAAAAERSASSRTSPKMRR